MTLLGIVASSKMGFWSVKPGRVLVRTRWKEQVFDVASLVKMQQVKCCGENGAYISILKLFFLMENSKFSMGPF